ncbi:hypothetical protein N7492_009232 [Penicillium capsulatum]|uniref:AB hydrolase-1 domain-containing protein n=1 Tax=Penicillium capsulatum TaxID=69766 RepID=A0A9W9HU53_9EURO|nr:hypothetical protein N7492_009232 [Penicillium capsulatum]KAJ6106628.1 hypothetical protein N7512_010145 [Penicillium capsulatum]
MKASIVGLCAATVGVAAAKNCVNTTIDIDVSARNGVFDKIDTPRTNSDAISFILSTTRQGGNGTADALSGYKTVHGRYQISAQYCSPDEAPNSGQTLQILSHGVGFDKTYWDLPYNNFNYSYVDHALSQGYHTLSYDRLGVGKSSRSEPKNETQLFLEIEALAELTKVVRGGNVPNVDLHPEKIVHVGHSFGSALAYAMTAEYPDLSDAIALTGFSMNASYFPLFMAGANFHQAHLDEVISKRAKTDPSSKYPEGYLTSGDISSNEFLFFTPNHFDPEILEFAEQSKQPATVGELLTVGSLPAESKFAGPVFVITGSNDVPFCGGDCLSTGGAASSIPAAAKAVFKSAKEFTAFIQPNSGHGLNFHYNAKAGYQKISSFLKSHGLDA